MISKITTVIIVMLCLPVFAQNTEILKQEQKKAAVYMPRTDYDANSVKEDVDNIKVILERTLSEQKGGYRHTMGPDDLRDALNAINRVHDYISGLNLVFEYENLGQSLVLQKAKYLKNIISTYFITYSSFDNHNHILNTAITFDFQSDKVTNSLKEDSPLFVHIFSGTVTITKEDVKTTYMALKSEFYHELLECSMTDDSKNKLFQELALWGKHTLVEEDNFVVNPIINQDQYLRLGLQ